MSSQDKTSLNQPPAISLKPYKTFTNSLASPYAGYRQLIVPAAAAGERFLCRSQERYPAQ
jgi:hypothetical protein